MKKIEELEKELYGEREGDLTKRKEHTELPTTNPVRPEKTAWVPEVSPAMTSPKAPRTLLRVVFVGAILVFLLMGGIFVFFYFGTSGTEVVARFAVRDRVEAGEAVTVPLVIRNTSRVAVKAVEATFDFPPRTILREFDAESSGRTRVVRKITDVGPGEEAKIEIDARFFGREGEEQAIDAVVRYQPEGLQAQFESRAKQSIVIARVPLSLAWDLPKTVTRSQKVELVVHYSSDAKISFPEIYLRMSYPSGFTRASATPEPIAGTDIWKLGVLEPLRAGAITLQGTISGEEGVPKTFRGELGFYDERTKEWRLLAESRTDTTIAVAPFSIQAMVGGAREGAFSPGDQLAVSVRYKNNTDYVLRNIALRAIPTTVVGSSPYEGLLQFENMTIDQGGVLESGTRALVWSPGGTPALAELKPGEEGEVTFLIRTRARPVIRTNQDKNIVVRLRAIGDVLGVPQELAGADLRVEDSVEFKVRTKVLFGAKALYRSSPLAVSGPLPPKVGKKTIYTVIWDVRNLTNDAENSEIVAAIPPNIKWEGQLSTGVDVTFDQAAGQVRWRIGRVRAGTGVLGPGMAAAFQLSLTPAEADIGTSPRIIQEARFSGKDIFTNEDVNERTDVLTTELREDPLSSSSEWAVVK